MSMQRTLGWSLTALLITAVACSDQDTTGPGTTDPNLSSSEAGFLAVEVDRTLDGILGEAFTIQAPVSGPLATDAPPSAVPIITTFSFERTRTCPAGGQVVVSGSGQLIVDPDEATAEMSVAGSKLIEACARERNEIVYTMNGSAEWDAFWKRVDRELVAAEKNVSGAFSISTSDDRVKECTFELHAVYDPTTNSVQVTGHFCDRTIDRTWSRG